MADDRLERGLDLWQDFAELINTIVERDGKIDRNDPRIWQGVLHKWDNSEWILVLEAMLQLKQQYPEVFKHYHSEALMDAIKAILAGEDKSDRVLDKRLNKGKAWKVAMAMPEVWNNCKTYVKPVKAVEVLEPVKASRVFGNLFEFQ
jgi:hypothetical protein